MYEVLISPGEFITRTHLGTRTKLSSCCWVMQCACARARPELETCCFVMRAVAFFSSLFYLFFFFGCKRKDRSVLILLHERWLHFRSSLCLCAPAMNMYLQFNPPRRWRSCSADNAIVRVSTEDWACFATNAPTNVRAFSCNVPDATQQCYATTPCKSIIIAPLFRTCFISQVNSSPPESLSTRIFIYLREDECVTKVENETPVNTKKPSPSEVSWDFAVRSTQHSYLPEILVQYVIFLFYAAQSSQMGLDFVLTADVF